MKVYLLTQLGSNGSQFLCWSEKRLELLSTLEWCITVADIITGLKWTGWTAGLVLVTVFQYLTLPRNTSRHRLFCEAFLTLYMQSELLYQRCSLILLSAHTSAFPNMKTNLPAGVFSYILDGCASSAYTAARGRDNQLQKPLRKSHKRSPSREQSSRVHGEEIHVRNVILTESVFYVWSKPSFSYRSQTVRLRHSTPPCSDESEAVWLKPTEETSAKDCKTNTRWWWYKTVRNL